MIQTKLEIKNIQTKKNKFQCLILNTKTTKNSFSGKILGLTLAEWIKFACSDIPCVIQEYDNKTNIVEFSKKFLDSNYDYTIILLSKTPLITNFTIKNLIEYCDIKKTMICKLPVGYVVNNQYVLNNTKIEIDNIFSQNMEEFYLVENKIQFTYALRVLQERINSFHIENGVDIVNPNTVYIEPFVDIAKGVKIFSNNSIKGNSKIGRNVILKENNVIDNSKIGDNSCVSGSEIISSIISNNVYISSFSVINNSLIGEDVLIEKGASITNYNVPANTKIKANSLLGDTDDSNSRIG